MWKKFSWKSSKNQRPGTGQALKILGWEGSSGALAGVQGPLRVASKSLHQRSCFPSLNSEPCPYSD